MKNMKPVVTFGEIMLRLDPPQSRLLCQELPGKLHAGFAGAEANVSCSLARLGMAARFVTVVPDNDISDAFTAFLRSLDVDTSFVRKVDYGRFGIFYLETGSNQRPSRVIYDRAGSSIAMADSNEYDWTAVFTDAGWFHFSGITPALSEQAAAATLAAVKAARAAGLKVSCDLNFRGKLWAWKKGCSARNLAREVMAGFLPHVDVLLGNEEDASDVLDIRSDGTDVYSGKLEVGGYPAVARRIVERYPNLSFVATTLRESVSATHNNWGGMLLDSQTDQIHFAPMRGERYDPYRISSVVDRVGAGDSFSAALIYALRDPSLSEPQTAIDFATAASCLAHSISGDINYSSRAAVESLMHGSGSGRVVR